MIKETISGRQTINIMILFIFGSAIVLGPARGAKQDAWLSYMFAIALSIMAAFVYSKLITAFPGKDIYDIMEIVYGRVLGKIMILLFSWYAFHLGSLVIRNFTEFIQVVSLPETPQFFIAISIGIFCIYVVRSGIEVLARWSMYMCPLIIITILLMIALAIPSMELINLTPVLSSGLKPVITTSLMIFSFPFAETVIFTAVLSSLKVNKDAFKVYCKSYIIAGFILLTITLRNIMVLGQEFGPSTYFPSHIAVSVIRISDILQRMEILVSINFLLAGIVKIGICLYAASKGVAKLFKLNDYKIIAAPIGLLMINMSLFIYSSIMEMVDWAFKVYPYYAFLYEVIIPLVLLLGTIIKLKLTKPSDVKSS